MKKIVFIGVVIALLRVLVGVYPEFLGESIWLQVYKDAAHIFMGGLGVAWWYDKCKWQWNLFWGLNVVEVTTVLWGIV